MVSPQWGVELTGVLKMNRVLYIIGTRTVAHVKSNIDEIGACPLSYLYNLI